MELFLKTIPYCVQLGFIWKQFHIVASLDFWSNPQYVIVFIWWEKKQKRHNDAEPVHANDLSASKFVKNYKIFCTIINFDTYRIIFRSFLLDQKTKTITKINKHEKLWQNTVYSAPP